jgi:transcriptional regulator with XRE-family HTH domain
MRTNTDKGGALPKIVESAKQWQKDLALRVGAAVQARRKELNLTASTLADRTAELGYPISRVAIGKIETGHREGKLDLAELVVLASALGIPPVTLLFGGAPDKAIESLPGEKATSVATLAWFVGDRELAWPGPEHEPDEARDQANAAIADPSSPAVALLDLIRQRSEKHREIHLARRGLSVIDKDSEQFGRALEHIGVLVGSIETLNIVIDAAVAQSEGESQ